MQERLIVLDGSTNSEVERPVNLYEHTRDLIVFGGCRTGPDLIWETRVSDSVFELITCVVRQCAHEIVDCETVTKARTNYELALQQI